MKPHEETWKATSDGWVTVSTGGDLFRDRAADGPPDTARALLAAQAPAMARAMLAFVSQEFDAPHPMTPEERGKHAETMLDVLRAAGVVPT